MHLHSIAVLIACGLLCTACAKPALQYPRCAGDADCASEASRKPHDEHCVFGQCQTCAADAHCGPDEVCREGRCASAPSASRSVDEAFGCAPAAVHRDDEANSPLVSLRRCRVA